MFNGSSDHSFALGAWKYSGSLSNLLPSSTISIPLRWSFLVFILFLFWCCLLFPTSSLDSIPGPKIARYSSLYRVYLYLSGHGPEFLCELHSKYGPLVRIGPNHISTSDPDIANQLYGVGDRFKKASPVILGNIRDINDLTVPFL